MLSSSRLFLLSGVLSHLEKAFGGQEWVPDQSLTVVSLGVFVTGSARGRGSWRHGILEAGGIRDRR